MTFKVHKIKGIDKNICCCEQKIAYNYAFSYYGMAKRCIKPDMPEFNKSASFVEIENLVLKNILRNEKMKKYNIDAIMIAFRNGFRRYCNNYFIASDYESIGKMFQIPYETI